MTSYGFKKKDAVNIYVSLEVTVYYIPPKAFKQKYLLFGFSELQRQPCRRDIIVSWCSEDVFQFWTRIILQQFCSYFFPNWPKVLELNIMQGGLQMRKVFSFFFFVICKNTEYLLYVPTITRIRSISMHCSCGPCSGVSWSRVTRA